MLHFKNLKEFFWLDYFRLHGNAGFELQIEAMVRRIL